MRIRTLNVDDQIYREAALISPSNFRKSQFKQQKTFDDEPLSSYYKVNLTTSKAKKRQSSLGQRSQTNRIDSEMQSLNSGHFGPSNKRKCPLPMMPKIKKLYEDPEPRMKFSASVCVPQSIGEKQLITGSDSFRNLPDPKLAKNFSDKPVSFCEIEQKTLTSVKKTQKISNNLSSLSPQVHPPKSRLSLKAKPSQEFMENVITNKNNMLKPPNWTQRKQSLMKRHNYQDSPSLVSNIDYHLDMLSSMYKQKSKNEPSLMD